MKKNCINCNHWHSFYMAYDQDPDEPHDVGYCRLKDPPYPCVCGFETCPAFGTLQIAGPFLFSDM